MSLVTREDFVREALRLRADGLTVREVAERFGVARSTADSWINDPDLSKQRARRKRYQGICERCGGATDGGNGKAKAPKLCKSCYEATRPRAEHGTLSRYQAGCRCEECRGAQRDHMRSLKGQEPPQHGTESGYSNYGCRCEACRAAHRQYGWLHPEYNQRWVAKVRGTEPPRHGYRTGYQKYGCRCEECRAWARNDRRIRRARKAAA